MRNLRKVLLGLVLGIALIPISAFALGQTGDTVVKYDSSPPVVKYKVNFTPGRFGHLEGKTLFYVERNNSLGSEKIPKAVPDNGYVFDKWVNKSTVPSSIVTNWSKEVIVKPTNYQAEFKKNRVSLVVKNVTIYVGDKWHPIDGFVSATDVDGKNVSFDKISVIGNVNPQRKGTYNIIYKYENLKKVISVFVKDDPRVAMYRLYNPNSGEHFYTESSYERDSVERSGWRYEGIGWYAPQLKKGLPVYRLYNPNAGDHHYTMSRYERDSLRKVGWRYEGIGWYSKGKIPLYREYNPNAKSGAHNYTVSKFENDALIKVGWRYEGIAWYALSK